MNKDFSPPIPRDKHDTERAAALVSLGWATVLPVVPEILTWMQDLNWPVARVFQPFLIDAGAPLAPYIKLILASDDSIWKYTVLVGVVGQSPPLAAALHADLARLAAAPTTDEQIEGVTEQARAILAS